MFRTTLLLAILVVASFAGDPSFGQQGGIKRTFLQTVDAPQGHQTIMDIAELAPGAAAGRHTHPGAEVSYVLEGEITLLVDGKPPQVFKAGDTYNIPAGVVHGARNAGGRPVKVLSVWVIEKGKPLVSPAK
jgi:quercetin dioxygenase-like cupin family protein